MARTVLPKISPLGPYIQGQPAAGALAFVLSASDNINGNSFVASGKELLVIQNTDAGTQNFSIVSVPDSLGRSQDVTSFSMPTGTFAIFKLDQQIGWVQGDGNIYLNTSAATVKFAAVKL